MKPRRWLLAAALVFGLALSAQHAPQGQESAGHAEEAAAHGAAGHGALDLWKWANFLLLGGVLFWLGRKGVQTFFVNRSRDIRKAIVEAEEIRADAERRAAEVDRRLSNLGVEIEALRREARAEEEAEAERSRRELAAEMAKIQQRAEQDIAAAGKQARLELKRYSAELAIRLAEQKVRGRMTPQTQEALVDSFVRQMDDSAGAQPS